LRTLISIRPEALGDPENFNNARITTTPTHIKPEWYFLFAYRILRSVPSKLGGVVAMGASILILIVLAIKKNLAPKKFNPPKKIIFWLWVRIFILLTWAGGKPVNEVSRLIAQNLTLLYFSIRVAL
jgi:quinol-cytochrome oxidoreductase complex cytochrome b subunit